MEGACLLAARAPGHRLWPRCFPCVSVSILGWLLLLGNSQRAVGNPERQAPGLPSFCAPFLGPVVPSGTWARGAPQAGTLACPHEGPLFPWVTCPHQECSHLVTRSGSWTLSHRNNRRQKTLEMTQVHTGPWEGDGEGGVGPRGKSS